MLSQTKELCAFLDASHSQYHARAYLTAILDKAGYTPEGIRKMGAGSRRKILC